MHAMRLEAQPGMSCRIQGFVAQHWLGHQIVRLRLANKTVVCETIFQKCIGLSRIVIEGLWKANHSLMLAFECSQLMLDVYS